MTIAALLVAGRSVVLRPFGTRADGLCGMTFSCRRGTAYSARHN